YGSWKLDAVPGSFLARGLKARILMIQSPYRERDMLLDQALPQMRCKPGGIGLPSGAPLFRTAV
ncbi:MAG: hypothetical protein M3Z32_10585, partial [Acidobacteriota bacterium]|nr:hypothetical protein [Acidobacteriota bacterium]